MLTRRRLLSVLSVLPALRLLSGQQSPPPEQTPKYSADAKVVNLFATVRDKSGNIVKDLNKDNFQLDEEGRPQTIKFFERETSLPLYLGMLVDTSGSQARVLGDERTAGLKFFDQILREDRDLTFVIHFDYEVELLQDFTASRQNLENALNLLKVGQPPQQQTQPQGGNNPQNGGYPPGTGYPGGGYPGSRRYPPGGGYPQGGARGPSGGGTKMYDAILLASEDLMSKQRGRKALILLTDGVDTGSKVTLFQAISSAQRADTLVYSVLFSDPSAYGNNYGYPGGYGGTGMGRRGRVPMPAPMPGGGGQNLPDGKKVLQQISQETGGRFYQVSHFHPIDKIFAEIEEDLRSQYSIGYTSDQPAEPGSYRHVHLTAKTAKKKELIVQTRGGYYAN
ncbi:MAG TPA: VWA domain-containing protein [Verrucomicrobiae bacterium]|nr:VWA domain-containing protein [Verrucomicrobiae bacterium]